MGNCQAVDVAMVLIQHPDGKVERAYLSLTASHVMASNPGHYVAAVIVAPPPSSTSSSGASSTHGRVKHLKLLRPDDTLLLGHVYRLVSFEEVIREFASKRHVKLSRVVIKAKEDNQATSSRSSGRRRSSRRRRGSGRAIAAEPERPSLEKLTLDSEEARTEPNHPNAEPSEPELDLDAFVAQAGMMFGRRVGAATRQWRPALQSIAEGAMAS